MEKSPELIIAETLQTHLFAHNEFKKHLVQETLYSLAQNGSLTGLIHLLVLVLVQFFKICPVAYNFEGCDKPLDVWKINSFVTYIRRFCVCLCMDSTHCFSCNVFYNAGRSSKLGMREFFFTLDEGHQQFRCLVLKLIQGQSELVVQLVRVILEDFFITNSKFQSDGIWIRRNCFTL